LYVFRNCSPASKKPVKWISSILDESASGHDESNQQQQTANPIIESSSQPPINQLLQLPAKPTETTPDFAVEPVETTQMDPPTTPSEFDSFLQRIKCIKNVEYSSSLVDSRKMMSLKFDFYGKPFVYSAIGGNGALLRVNLKALSYLIKQPGLLTNQQLISLPIFDILSTKKYIDNYSYKKISSLKCELSFYMHKRLFKFKGCGNCELDALRKVEVDALAVLFSMTHIFSQKDFDHLCSFLNKYITFFLICLIRALLY
jgi:hypothetical protein